MKQQVGQCLPVALGFFLWLFSQQVEQQLGRLSVPLDRLDRQPGNNRHLIVNVLGCHAVPGQLVPRGLVGDREGQL